MTPGILVKIFWKLSPPAFLTALALFGTMDGQGGLPTSGFFLSGKELEEAETPQRDLLHALGTRKLVHEELNLVSPTLNVFANQSYFACVKYAELYDLLIKQWELQTGQKWPGCHLSAALGEYNRCPQEYDNLGAVKALIFQLQQL